MSGGEGAGACSPKSGGRGQGRGLSWGGGALLGIQRLLGELDCSFSVGDLRMQENKRGILRSTAENHVALGWKV